MEPFSLLRPRERLFKYVAVKETFAIKGDVKEERVLPEMHSLEFLSYF